MIKPSSIRIGASTVVERRPDARDGREASVRLLTGATTRDGATEGFTEPAIDRAHASAGDMSLLKAIVDSTEDHVHVKDLDGRYLLINQADAEWCGYEAEEMVGRTDAELIDAEEAAESIGHDRAVIESGHPVTFEQEATRDGVTRTWLTTKNVVRDAAGHMTSLFTISHEITDQRRQETQLREAARMEAVGELAGGIAHDFNNILTAIRGYTELARHGLGSEARDVQADLEQVVLAADRAAELTRQLLAFSRRQVLAPRILEPAEVVGGIAPMLRLLLGGHVELTVRSADHVGHIRVDPAQLEQVILNLALNARDAMPRGGKLTIEMANAELDADYVADHRGAMAGPHVRLSVTDTGTGMDAAVRERIFEPFFTTKGPGKGTGLGLATVYGIVKQSGGSIYVYSEPGYGSTFHVYFPRVRGEANPLVRVTPTTAVPTGTETILLAEDERAVRVFARRALTGLGYTVLEAANGREALSLAAEHGAAIDLLLTDVIMPGMQGPALAAQLATLQPGLRTLYVSGFPEDSIVRDGVNDDDVAYLPKPFSAEALGRAVRSVLDATE